MRQPACWPAATVFPNHIRTNNLHQQDRHPGYFVPDVVSLPTLLITVHEHGPSEQTHCLATCKNYTLGPLFGTFFGIHKRGDNNISPLTGAQSPQQCSQTGRGFFHWQICRQTSASTGPQPHSDTWGSRAVDARLGSLRSQRHTPNDLRHTFYMMNVLDTTWRSRRGPLRRSMILTNHAPPTGE
ncbi:hypothetical protein HRR77_009613 [Exophiala dermatitidis]|nr:hypothetical protein HRR77_009613 [Exophiala dermatitidis]